MSDRPTSARAMLLALALASAGVLGGCASDGIELNGKIFDAMGVSSQALAAKKVEPVVPERTGLVMPPSAALPPPGSTTAIAGASGEQLWPADPDQQLALARAEQERLNKEKCEKPDPAAVTEGAANHKYTRCGTIWTSIFNSGLDQPENAQGLPSVMQKPQPVMVPAASGTIPPPQPEETASTGSAQQ